MIIEQMKVARNKRAREIAGTRRALMEAGVPARRRCGLLRRLYPGQHPIKPTLKNLYRLAIAELKFSRSRWNNPYDTEYYSA